jgi:hypothetical protein
MLAPAFAGLTTFYEFINFYGFINHKEGFGLSPGMMPLTAPLRIHWR